MRRIGGLISLLMLAVLLVACGGESADDDPTAVPTVAAPPTETDPTPASQVPTLSVLPASPVASPVGAAVASPIASPVSPVASPGATPVAVLASPVASPIASPIEMATPQRTTWLLEGTVVLPGLENEKFVLGGDGCVGLGDYAGVQAGQQVVVRNAVGTIIGLTTLADGGTSTECVWTFTVEVPVSDFYNVSLPLIFERVYSDADVAVVDGRLQIRLP